MVLVVVVMLSLYLALGIMAVRQVWLGLPLSRWRHPATALALTLIFGCGVLAGPQATVPVPLLALLGLAAWNCLYPSQLPAGDLSLYLLQPFMWEGMAAYSVLVIAGYYRSTTPLEGGNTAADDEAG